MRKLKSYLSSTVFKASFSVLLVLLTLNALAELINQLEDIRGDYTFVEALIYVALKVPGSLVDYLALAALIGCLIGLGSLASSSELVVMRSAGMSVTQLVWGVMRIVLVMIIFAALISEYVVPYSSQVGESRRSLALGLKENSGSVQGVWNREGNEYMRFGAVLPNGKLFGITRYRFDEQNKLVEASYVESAIFQGNHWFEQDGEGTRFSADNRLENYRFDTRVWTTDLSPDLLDILTLETERLPLQRLHSYASYLDKQNIDAGQYWLAFWSKVFQPLATLSLVMIAISFILGPLRQVPIGYRVFVGILVGLSFQTAQRLLGPSSLIWGFSPIFAVLIPIAICFLIGALLIRRSQ